MQIELSPEETSVVLEVVDGYLSDLSMEISHTDLLDFRERLKNKRRVLEGVVGRLRSPATA